MECQNYVFFNNDGSDVFNSIRIEFDKRTDPHIAIDALAKELAEETKNEVKVNLKPGTKINPETGYTKSFLKGGRYPIYSIFVPECGIIGRVDCASQWGETALTINLRQSFPRMPSLDTPIVDTAAFLRRYAERNFTQTDPDITPLKLVGEN